MAISTGKKARRKGGTRVAIKRSKKRNPESSYALKQKRRRKAAEQDSPAPTSREEGGRVRGGPQSAAGECNTPQWA